MSLKGTFKKLNFSAEEREDFIPCGSKEEFLGRQIWIKHRTNCAHFELKLGSDLDTVIGSVI